MSDAITLLQLNSRIASAVAADKGLADVWVTGEVSDLRVSGGHCYLELIEKEPESGKPIARLRAVIWASAYARLAAGFHAATGQRLASDMKVMVKVNVNFHTVFGLSAVITAINPEYTAGELLLRRRMILERLAIEGIIDMNKTLPLPDVMLRIAVVSARGAAGYGDFINQLLSNPRHLRFSVTLFPAVMQGEKAPQSIVAALDEIGARAEDFDCVAIIRGGGATGDLASFDDYDLAANVAQFPLPVIVGVGHERDVTVLDFVAAVSVKTPTAAAEWLVARGESALDKVRDLASEIFREASSRVSGGLQYLSYCEGLLPSLSLGQLDCHRRAVETEYPDMLVSAADYLLKRGFERISVIDELVAAMSPDAVLKRGYAICRVNGHAVKSVSEIGAGVTVETRISDGVFESSVNIVKNI